MKIRFPETWKIRGAASIVSGLILGWQSLSSAYAAVDSAPQASITSIGGIFCIIDDGFDLMFWLLIALVTVMVMVAAYTYLTASDDSEKVGKATKIITYAAVAVAVALVARGIPLIVGSFFGVTGLNNSQCG